MTTFTTYGLWAVRGDVRDGGGPEPGAVVDDLECSPLSDVHGFWHSPGDWGVADPVVDKMREAVVLAWLEESW